MFGVIVRRSGSSSKVEIHGQGTKNVIFSAMDAHDLSTSESELGKTTQTAEARLKCENKNGGLRDVPQWGPGKSPWWRVWGEAPIESDDTFVKTCHFVTVLRMIFAFISIY